MHAGCRGIAEQQYTLSRLTSAPPAVVAQMCSAMSAWRSAAPRPPSWPAASWWPRSSWKWTHPLLAAVRIAAVGIVAVAQLAWAAPAHWWPVSALSPDCCPPLPLAVRAGRRLQAVLQNGDGTMPLIFAAGGMLKDGTPIQHYATAADSPPLLASDAAAAAAAGGVVQGEDDEGGGSMRAVSQGGVLVGHVHHGLQRQAVGVWHGLHRIAAPWGA